MTKNVEERKNRKRGKEREGRRERTKERRRGRERGGRQKMGTTKTVPEVTPKLYPQPLPNKTSHV